MRFAKWTAIVLCGLTIAVIIAVAIASRTEPLRRLVVTTLAERLDSDVELASFAVDAFPRLTVSGTGLVIRLRGRRDVPPLIEIGTFTVHGGMLDLVRRPRRFRQVTLDQLVVNIPPGGFKRAGERVGPAPRETAAGGAAPATPPPAPSAGELGTDGPKKVSPIIIAFLQADGALLRIIPRRADKQPREFAIHRLQMETLGQSERMPFRAQITNPVPRGLVDTTGTFGPWQLEEPGATPLGGSYSFQNADLNTIKGIAGTLGSTGDFGGALNRIAVKGETRTPDFRIDVSGQPVNLVTVFDAIVDGTDGDTYLNEVNAQFLGTSLTAKGAVTRTKGIKGWTTRLSTNIMEGRVEDLLTLTVKSTTPLLRGGVTLKADFLLPPGPDDVIRRIKLDGQFAIKSAAFSDHGLQEKLGGMSQRARGLDPDRASANVVSDLTGKFTMGGGTLGLSALAFSMPGATVNMHGSYGLVSQELAFDGHLRMQATVSQAAGVGGVKGFFLKLADPLFRRQGAGAVIPLRVRGTREDPKFGVDVKKALLRK